MSWETGAQYWRQLPPRSNFLFLCAVFSLFAAISFIGSRSSPLVNLCFAVPNGLFAALWAFAGTRRHIKTMLVLLPIQMLWNVAMTNLLKRVPTEHFALSENPDINIPAAIGLVISGYALFLVFFRFEAGRYYATLTEMRLAGEIHRSLVPEIQLVESSFEFYGSSWPSGEVGGDLVDVIRSDWGWLAYVADVSGHGVPAGVLMTMMKSAARTRLAAVGPDRFLPAMNDVLTPLSEPNMYVTLALLGYSGGALHFATAGHVPILHYRHSSRQVDEHSNENFPVALLGHSEFEVAQIGFEPGDVLVILTDGLTEAADDADRELGLAPLKTVLENNADAPLSRIAQQLRAAALAHGKQTDDQTLLLVRATLAPVHAPSPAV